MYIKGTNPPKDVVVPIELPPAPIEPQPIEIQPAKPEPIVVIEPKQDPIVTKPIEAIIPTPSYGGGGGYYGGYEDGRGGLGREQYLSEINQRENLQ